jgi:hypothetical protein
MQPSTTEIAMLHPIDPAAVVALIALAVVLAITLQPRRRLLGALVHLVNITHRRHRRTLHVRR